MCVPWATLSATPRCPKQRVTVSTTIITKFYWAPILYQALVRALSTYYLSESFQQSSKVDIIRTPEVRVSKLRLRDDRWSSKVKRLRSDGDLKAGLLSTTMHYHLLAVYSIYPFQFTLAALTSQAYSGKSPGWGVRISYSLRSVTDDWRGQE